MLSEPHGLRELDEGDGSVQEIAGEVTVVGPMAGNGVGLDDVDRKAGENVVPCVCRQFRIEFEFPVLKQDGEPVQDAKGRLLQM